ncbi:hypothetical protein [Propionispora hippei]|uniref:Uncharacterized protein n=1 Tax=Propionispora hippei DSM 15287 TaxID=1123003 RepID=A0A1M6EGY7_9FIRM|nr:hypothetical protein [Propionispora hippei]SHI84746.1 hypothetical protein SAMN02745170_01190 [Propionispora hippei DSM 15287]
MKKLLALTVALLVIWLGWLLTHPGRPTSPATDNQTSGSQEPASQAIPPAVPAGQKAAEASTETVPASGRETNLGSQQLGATKTLTPAGKQENLSEQTYHLQKEEKKGVQILPGIQVKDGAVQILPGVQVKSGAVQIEMDKDKDKQLEIERHPDNSNSDYQIMLKQKF